MKTLLKQKLLLLFVVATLMAVAAKSSPVKVWLDGLLVSSNGMVVKGKVYLPAEDLAKALGKPYLYDPGTHRAVLGALKKIAEGSESSAQQLPGGANPEEGVEGKADAWLFNGSTRLMVFSNAERIEDGIVYTLEVRNGTRSYREYSLDHNGAQPVLYDEHGFDYTGEAEPGDWYELYPGTPKKVKVKFHVPEDVRPAKLVLRIAAGQRTDSKIELFRVNL